MKKRASKTRGKPQRPVTKDLPVVKSGSVKGGAKSYSDIPIIKLVDKSTPSLG